MPLIRMGGGGEQFNEAEIIYGTLLAGETVVVLEDPHITTTSILDIYIEEEFYNFAPETVSTEEGKAILTYPETKEQDITVAIKLLGTKEYETQTSKLLDKINSNLTQLEQKVESGLTYSTDEHIVGKWIDGRDVYEKTYSAKNIDIFNTTQIIDASFNSNNVELIGCEKVFIFSDGAQAVTSYNYSSGSSNVRVNANVTPNGIALESSLIHIVGYNLTYKYVKK